MWLCLGFRPKNKKELPRLERPIAVSSVSITKSAISFNAEDYESKPCPNQ